MAETTHTQSNGGISFRWQWNLFTVFCSILQSYITFKLPRGDMDTPPHRRNFFRYLAIGMCHFRHLWNGMCDHHRAEITVMQFTGHFLPVHHFLTAQWEFLFTLSHIVSQAVSYKKKQQLYGQLSPISKTIKICGKIHAGPCRRIKDELISDIVLWTPFKRICNFWTIN